MSKLTLFIDLDGVLVDFIGGAAEAHGLDPEVIKREWNRGDWNCVPTFAKALNRPALNRDEFWEPVNNSSPRFWETLKPTRFLEPMIALAEEFTDDWWIVTAPSNSPQSYSGKVKWMKAFFGSDFDRFIITSHKELLAKQNRVLIDDREYNVRKFCNNGGMGIVFPSLGNALYEFADDPMPTVRDALVNIFGLLRTK